MSKIIIRLKGGLGNQMFMYAFALAFSKKTKHFVYFDLVSGFIKNDFKHLQTTRPLLNNYFESILSLPIYYQPFLFLLRKFQKIGNFYYLKGEFDDLEYLHNHNKIGGKNLFFEGYFQNYNYIKNEIPQIRNTIKLKDLGKYSNLINTTNSVGIHVRANDYNVKLSEDYYERAYKIINRNFPDFNIFLFSDNFDWCSRNLSFFDSCKLIDTGDDEIDFHLLTRCAHHIISIGTFGWWGAILNSINEGVVVAPKINFSFYNNQYYPENWILI